MRIHGSDLNPLPIRFDHVRTMEAAAEKIIFFEEATGVWAEKYMRAYKRRRLVATRFFTMT